ncbi:PREDICTED: mas-related G-protein coupled receptor member D-like [Elephantulus edwardii]|uniref:mas-related G-protein coupled receptor member D-like n=1 Tax=Elephantulus edwardii TaxID=28737 RepID=UPI0003F0AF23|nr:PREDICTED: mas-related G-protein coupled receptor member D-like [Elephantulus edwardii]
MVAADGTIRLRSWGSRALPSSAAAPQTSQAPLPRHWDWARELKTGGPRGDPEQQSSSVSPKMENLEGTNQTQNNSETADLTQRSPTMDAWYTACHVFDILTLLTCVCGMVGNGVVVWLLGFRVQRNPFSVYVLNLAVADFLFLLGLFSNDYAEYFPLNWVITYFSISVMLFAYVTSLSFLTTISVQRCLSVLFPIWYKVRRPRHLSTVVCTLLWGLNLLVISMIVYFVFVTTRGHSQQYGTILTFLSILFLGVFTPVMILSSMVLSVQTLRRPRAWRRRSSRLFVIVLVSVLVFVVCSLPFGIYWTLTYRLPILSPWYHFLLEELTQFTSALGSSANPIIYFLVGSESGSSLWDPLTAILSRAFQENPELGRKEMSPTSTNDTETESQEPMGSAQLKPALP